MESGMSVVDEFTEDILGVLAQGGQILVGGEVLEMSNEGKMVYWQNRGRE